jgi:hypothetical protein
MGLILTMTKTTLTNFERTDTNSTDSFFNNYFTVEQTISSATNDALITYFERVTDNKESALALANAVISTSLSQQIDPMETLKSFSAMAKEELNAYLCMFLNLDRANTSLLGINNQPVKNKYIERCVLP